MKQRGQLITELSIMLYLGGGLLGKRALIAGRVPVREAVGVADLGTDIVALVGRIRDFEGFVEAMYADENLIQPCTDDCSDKRGQQGYPEIVAMCTEGGMAEDRGGLT